MSVPTPGSLLIPILVLAWLAGLALGVGARVVLEILAWAVPELARPSAQGTVDVILVGTMLGVVAGAPYLLWRASRGGRRIWMGAVWGALLLAASAFISPAGPRAVLAELGFSGRILAQVLFGALFVGWGAGLEAVSARFGPGGRPVRARDGGER
jgi:hypothetical protein